MQRCANRSRRCPDVYVYQPDYAPRLSRAAAGPNRNHLDTARLEFPSDRSHQRLVRSLSAARICALDYLITAAENKGVGKLLSSPQLVTQNNAMAVVKQGTQIPIQTTVNNTISVQYMDAVLKLQVTPQITADGTVFMDVLVENTQVDNGIPLVNGIPASRHAVRADQSADRRWRHGGHRRRDGSRSKTPTSTRCRWSAAFR